MTFCKRCKREVQFKYQPIDPITAAYKKVVFKCSTWWCPPWTYEWASSWTGDYRGAIHVLGDPDMTMRFQWATRLSLKVWIMGWIRAFLNGYPKGI
jgi:hypothetical protein